MTTMTQAATAEARAEVMEWVKDNTDIPACSAILAAVEAMESGDKAQKVAAYVAVVDALMGEFCDLEATGRKIGRDASMTNLLNLISDFPMDAREGAIRADLDGYAVSKLELTRAVNAYAAERA